MGHSHKHRIPALLEAVAHAHAYPSHTAGTCKHGTRHPCTRHCLKQWHTRMLTRPILPGRVSMAPGTHAPGTRLYRTVLVRQTCIASLRARLWSIRSVRIYSFSPMGWIIRATRCHPRRIWNPSHFLLPVCQTYL